MDIAIDFGEMLQSFERTFDMTGVDTHEMQDVSFRAKGLGGLASRSEEVFGSLARILEVHRSHRLYPPATEFLDGLR